MNLPFFIARRYIFAKKSTQAINLISGISGFGIFIGTAALIIILSVFNGFEKIAISMFGSFTPDLLIKAKTGKFFDLPERQIQTITKIKGVDYAIKSLEEKALLKLNQSQYIATIRGLDTNFVKTGALDRRMVEGKMILENKSYDYGVLGAGVQAKLGANIRSPEAITVFAPSNNINSEGGLSKDDFNRLFIYPSGVFSAGEDYDEHLVLVPIRFARKLLNEPKRISFLGIYFNPGIDIATKQKQISESLGNAFSVKNSFEQNEVQFKVLNSEKWAVYLILTFTLTIIVFNIMGSLTMLVMEKKKDISILSSMGASKGSIESIFLIEGMIISLMGTLLGLLVGYVFSVLQIKYGFIKIGENGSFTSDSYPIVIKALDYGIVFCTVLLISFLASFLAARQSRQNSLTIKEQLTVH